MKKTWMISTACAAVLAMSGMAAAQGMNEHSGGKNAPTAAQHEGQSPSHMKQEQSGRANQGQSGRAGAAQNRERGGAKNESAQRGTNERAGARETTGQGMSSEPSRRSGAGEKERAEPKASERTHEQNSGAMKERGEKSGSAMKERNEKSGAASTNERSNERMGRSDQNSERAGRNEQNERAGRNERGGTTTGMASHKEVNLTTEQRTKIRDVTRNVVIKEHKIPRLTKVNFDVRVGVRVPRTVTFYPVPQEIVAVYPAWSSYKVIFVNDELVLIDPATYEIVYVVTV